uniref:Putative ovule protein n=1 Tax=Solanum chacoense TaxID=4108 RepID=A0A0V0HRS5_SOLCH
MGKLKKKGSIYKVLQTFSLDRLRLDIHSNLVYKRTTKPIVIYIELLKHKEWNDQLPKALHILHLEAKRVNWDYLIGALTDI